MLNSILKSRIRCTKCDLRFIFEKYTSHQKVLKGSVTCTWCTASAYTICELAVHVYSKHTDKRAIFQQKYGNYEESNEDVIEIEETILNVCNDCGECFDNSEHLKDHLSKCGSKPMKVENDCEDGSSGVGAIVVNKENDTGVSGTSKTEIETNGKHYKCASCHLINDNLESLVQHIKLTHAESDAAMIPCSVCNVVFMKTSTLFQHLDDHLMTKNEVYVGVPNDCSVCQKQFHELEALHVHLNLHRPKKMICPVCRRRFKEENILRSHIASHNGIEYCCSDCDLMFSKYSSLLVHQQVHGEKGCVRCGKVFATDAGYRQHLKLHEKGAATHKDNKSRIDYKQPFGCNICRRCFKSIHELQLHTLAHLGKSVPHCIHCERTFQTIKGLNNHQKRYNGKCTSCRLCNKVFSTLASLRCHKRKKHPNEKSED